MNKKVCAGAYEKMGFDASIIESFSLEKTSRIIWANL